MTVADRTEGHQARCLPHLLMLRMLASDDAEAPSPWLVMSKVAQATAATYDATPGRGWKPLIDTTNRPTPDPNGATGPTSIGRPGLSRSGLTG